VIPVVTPEEMAAIDAAAPEPVEELIERAGAATAHHALAMLGGAYGRRVVVLAGPGNNGADGRAAARRLAKRGAKVVVHDARDAPARIEGVDLVVDAAFGTGLRRPYHPPVVAPDALVLAVDIPSGIDGLTGERLGEPLTADVTVTFAALKPGLLFAPGRPAAGEIVVADIGLDTSAARVHLVEGADVAAAMPRRAVDTHKWRHAVWVVGGSPGMTGAPALTALAAARAGAGYVRLSVPSVGGIDEVPHAPMEAVRVAIGDDLLLDPAELARVRALAVGPGLGRREVVLASARRLVASAAVPVVVDGDGLVALGTTVAAVVGGRRHATVLTPHDGEFAALTGAAPGPDRIAATRVLAAATGAVVLLKGAATVIAAPDGRVRVSVAGDARLATAGTGDVLTGVIAALLAQGLDAFDAASVGAFLHGTTAMSGPAHGLVASDVAAALPATLDDLCSGSR
jgi:hydroxyethylthiazole kinase-like uncharacterized protein yjeF